MSAAHLSAPLDDAHYFERLNELVARHGEGAPRLLIDLARLDANIDLTLAALNGRSLRIVVKSLPCVPLLEYVARRAGTRRFMSFHWPFLVQAARAFPDGDFLLGKPMPIAALGAFYARSLPTTFDPSRQITWLVDTRARLLQYLEFAKARGVRLRVAVELDVGMHRGGLASVGELDSTLALLAAEDEHLAFGGFMGYDAHASKAPWPHRPDGAVRRSNDLYRAFIERARDQHPDLMHDALIINGAGSPTLTLHDASSPLNDLSIGSALVKPTSFDLPSLAQFQPAAWIATPVLKRLPGLTFPFLERMPTFAGERDTLFVYGGKWMVEPAWPEDMRVSTMYGLSSNQQFMSIPRDARIAPDDHVFLRPTQSEAVLLEFGDLLAFDASERVHRWPVFSREVPHA